MDEREFVEEAGLVFEQRGMPRMAGRIIGWLLICDPPQQTMQDLTEALQTSKSSISTATRLLIQFGFIQRVSRPGERRDYYRMDADFWARAFENGVQQFVNFRQLAEKGLALLAGETPERKARLEDMYDTSLFMEQEYPALLERWHQLRKQRVDTIK